MNLGSGRLHPKPELHAVPARIHLLALPPYSPELNPVEVIGDVIKVRIANTLWQTLDALEAALGEELRPIYESAERVRNLVSHTWLIEQVNATVTENSAVTWYKDARKLFSSIDASTLLGIRDRAILAVLAYSGSRIGAVARLRLKDFTHEGDQWVLAFNDKGGKHRKVPVRPDLQRVLLAT